MSYARRPVVQFAKEMEKTLKKNDYKGGWQHCTFEYLHAKLHEEMMEVDREIYRGIKSRKNLKKELTDVANVCMMIWENLDYWRSDERKKNKGEKNEGRRTD